MALTQLLGEDLVAVTERAAVAASQTMGYGDAQRAAQIAAQAMHQTLEQLAIAGRVVVGADPPQDPAEEPDDPLRTGAMVGSRQDAADGFGLDLAVLPLEGKTLCATGAPGAISLLVASERGGLLPAPVVHMEKIVVGPTARGVVHLDAPVPENLRNIAAAFGREVGDLTVVVLDRPRHAQLIADLRTAGARVRLIPDGELSAAISVAVRGTGVHALMGSGAAAQAVVIAAAIRCLGGEIQARLAPAGPAEAEQLGSLTTAVRQRILTSQDLAPGQRIVISCTAVTDGELLRGVRFFGGGRRTSSLFMSPATSMIRFIDTIHREDIGSPVFFR